jgi:hypothetical protein
LTAKNFSKDYFVGQAAVRRTSLPATNPATNPAYPEVKGRRLDIQIRARERILMKKQADAFF